MEITGTLLEILPEVTEQGKNGTWSKRDILIETEGQYPKKVCITLFGDKVNTDGIGIGQNVVVNYNLESREHQGRWFTNVIAWKVSCGTNGQPQRAENRIIMQNFVYTKNRSGCIRIETLNEETIAAQFSDNSFDLYSPNGKLIAKIKPKMLKML